MRHHCPDVKLETGERVQERIWPMVSGHLHSLAKRIQGSGFSKEFEVWIASLYLLCRSSSCTRSSPSPASAPPSGAGSPRATPPCPSPSQTRCVGDGYSCIRRAHREKGGTMKNISPLLKVPFLFASSQVGGCALTFCKIYNIGC